MSDPKMILVIEEERLAAIARAERAEARVADLEAWGAGLRESLGTTISTMEEERARANGAEERAEHAEAECKLLKEHVRCVINERELATDMLRNAEAECEAMREILKACNYTLVVHGKIDHDTPLHYRIDDALNPSPADQEG